jgi:hypothetical protein
MTERIPKSEWGPGPWQSEPDRVDWIHAGLACFVRRGPVGALCGYVGVPAEHPLFGKGYQDVDADLDVHGGITYSDLCKGELCHVPAPGMPDHVWWFGFDCAHAGDVAPAMEAFRVKFIEPIHGKRPDYATELWPETYKTLAYVRRETEALADQLARMMPARLLAAPAAA